MIIKPIVDKNNYKYIELENKLKVLLINDETEISAITLTVNVGFGNDTIPGLAHFLEHMLFMGTGKYKQENYFHKFIIEGGGTTNAHTMQDSTSYYYQIINKYFEKSLEIFSQFFIDPLFSQKSINNEINAVNSEHEKNLTHDFSRIRSILKYYVKKSHPYAQFGTGTTNTLNIKNIRSLLFDFFNKYYSSNLMNLVIYSNMSLSKLELLVKQLFGKIKNKNVILNPVNDLPFGIKNNNAICSNLIKLVPIQKVKMLGILWQIPNIKYYEFKPIEYLIYMLNYEHEGSIIDYFRKNNMCIDMKVTIFDEDESFYLFGFYIELTDNGFTNIMNIIECIKHYITLLQKSDHENYYNEFRKINKINFDYYKFGDKMNYTVDLSMNLLKYDYKDVIYGLFKTNKFNGNTKKLLNDCFKYIEFNKSIIVIASDIYNKITNKKEKWYNVKYYSEQYPKSLGSEFNKYDLIKCNVKLPGNNNFIPKNIKLFKLKNIKYPVKLKDNIWYKYDNCFDIPKIYCDIYLVIKDMHMIKNYILIELYINLLNYHLSTKLYGANLCASGYFINVNINSIKITCYGFNETLSKIIKILIDSIINYIPTDDEFDFVKNEMILKFSNFINYPPYITIFEYIKEPMYLYYYDVKGILNELNKINIEDLSMIKHLLLNECKTKCFYYGNLSSEFIENDYFKIFNNKLSHQMTTLNKIILLDPGEQNIFIKKSVNVNENNNAILIFYEVDNIIKNLPNWENNLILLYIIEIYVREKFFTQLRTIEKTGYYVKSMVEQYNNNTGSLYGLSYFIQSPDYAPIILRKKIKKFVKNIYVDLINLSINELNNFKSILKTNIEMKFNSQTEEFSYYSYEILLNEYTFDYKEKIIKKLPSISKENLTKFYEKYFINKNTRKVRVCEYYKNIEK